MEDNTMKFRFWNKEKEELVYFNLLDLLGEEEVKSLDWKSFEITQYTGFKDRSDKEIYFDDIVKYSFHDEEEPENDMVDCVGLIVRTMSNGVGILSEGEITDFWKDDDMWTIEVVGNQYQNTEAMNNYNFFEGRK